ncbi:DUF6190 family protein [Streptomyces polygonati]|uniref:DUF6190 family protein n=1 Tax=Streptomyces polygonati TaxID=1617087 RepID=A0ABV8HSJ2_9ACTN
MTSDAVHVDATLFLGMNSTDEAVRVACKSFFASRLDGRVTMSLEQVGRCDDVVWRFPRAVQDAYYPFMDNLHTDMRIERLGYGRADLDAARDTPGLEALPAHERLLAGMVLARKGILYTASPRLLALGELPVLPPGGGAEAAFPAPLEEMYRTSLALRVTPARLWGEDPCTQD